MKKITILVMFVTIFSKTLGFLREIILNSFFYGSVSDTYNFASGIPESIISIIAAAFVTGIIPMLTKMKQDEKRIQTFTNNVLNIMWMFAGVIFLFMFIFPDITVVMMGGGGFHPEDFMIASYFVRMVAISAFSVVIIELGNGYLNVKNSFIIPAFVSIPANIFAISGIYLAHSYNNLTLLIGMQVAGTLVQALIVWFTMYKVGYRYRFFIDFKDEDLRIMLKLSIPVVLTSVLGQINNIFLTKATNEIMPHTGYTKMSNVYKLVGFVQGVFVSAILMVAYPNISRSIENKDRDKTNKLFGDTLLMLMFTIIPATTGFIILANPLLTFTYQYGIVTPEVILEMVPIFQGYSLLLIPYAIKELFIRMFYADEDMITPVKNSVLNSFLLIPLLLIIPDLSQDPSFKLLLLCLAMVGTSIICSFILYLHLKKSKPYLTLNPFKLELFKIGVASIVMGILLYILLNTGWSLFSHKISIFIEIIIGILIYFISLIILRSHFFMTIIKVFMRKGKDIVRKG